jgi:hypothetical protein
MFLSVINPTRAVYRAISGSLKHIKKYLKVDAM